VQLRTARPDDGDALAPLLEELGYPSSPDQIRRRIERVASDPDYRTLVAVDDGEVVGFAGLHRGHYYEHDTSWVQILALITRRDHQGGGVGSALLQAAEAWARESGAGRLSLTSGHRRAEDAHRFYLRRGWADTGRRFVKILE
jgi:GNAT superfamily N-acetyltransferase